MIDSTCFPTDFENTASLPIKKETEEDSDDEEDGQHLAEADSVTTYKNEIKVSNGSAIKLLAAKQGLTTGIATYENMSADRLINMGLCMYIDITCHIEGESRHN